MKSLLSIITGITIASCVNGSLTIGSFPTGSEVIVKDSRGEIQSSGKTPFTMPLGQSFFSASDFAIIEIQKTDFLAKSFIVPRTFFNSNHTLDVTLIAKPREKEQQFNTKGLDTCEQVSKKSLTGLGKGIAIVQSNLMRKQFQIADIKLAELIGQFPFVSVLYDLQGNLYYLQKQFDLALAAYERSLVVEPESVETARMVRRLRQITGQARKGTGR